MEITQIENEFKKENYEFSCGRYQQRWSISIYTGVNWIERREIPSFKMVDMSHAVKYPKVYDLAANDKRIVSSALSLSGSRHLETEI